MKENKVSIGLYNPKSPSNVGSVLRAAGCYDVNQVFYSGKRFENAAKYQTDTKNIQSKTPLRGVECLIGDLKNGIEWQEKATTPTIVCVELVEGATALPLYQHPTNAYYLFGPEDGSLPQGVIDQADAVVYVPTIGCMNLAATVNVLLYDRLAKSHQAIDDNARILASRDTNNRTYFNRD
jgi:tRNA(Leu) C34 or U34 (ribose-2'-O)-methylase TrmL